MADQHTGGQISGDDERRRREAALRAIAAQQPPAGATSTTATTSASARAQGTWPGTRRLTLLALLTLLLLGGGLFVWLRFSSSRGHPTTQRVALTFPDGALVWIIRQIPLLTDLWQDLFEE